MDHDGDVTAYAASASGAETVSPSEPEEILSGPQRMIGYVAGGAIGSALALAVLVLIFV